MADNLTAEKTTDKKRAIKKSTRVDLTPMVDLGFLLITFFVFTTTLSQAKAMDLATPKADSIVYDPVCESCVVTVIPDENNQLRYYEGAQENAVYKATDYSASGLRAVLMKKKKEATAIGRDAILIIRPGRKTSFKNLVNIIDESNIAMYKRYYLDDR